MVRVREIRSFVSPDEACAAFADSGATVRVTSDRNFVFIEGTAEALVRFAELIVAQADFEKDDGFEFSPKGAGRRVFTRGSNVGIYLHVLR
jgi:hypothetical protein